MLPRCLPMATAAMAEDEVLVALRYRLVPQVMCSHPALDELLSRLCIARRDAAELCARVHEGALRVASARSHLRMQPALATWQRLSEEEFWRCYFWHVAKLKLELCINFTSANRYGHRLRARCVRHRMQQYGSCTKAAPVANLELTHELHPVHMRNK